MPAMRQSAAVTEEGRRPRLLPIEAYSIERARRPAGVLLLAGTVLLAASVLMVWHVTYLPDEPPTYYWGYQIPERLTLPLLIGGGIGLGALTVIRPAGMGTKLLLALLVFFWSVLVLSELMSGYYESGVVVLREGFWAAMASFVAVVAGAAVAFWPRR